MTQEIIVVIIGLIVCLILGHRLYKFFFTKKEKGTNCGCSSCHCNSLTERKRKA